MKVYLRVEFEPGEDCILCEGCGEGIDVDAKDLQLILGHCDICDESIGLLITDFDIVSPDRH
jgi:hypothetical protein